jgi:hypothetical protein
MKPFTQTARQQAPYTQALIMPVIQAAAVSSLTGFAGWSIAALNESRRPVEVGIAVGTMLGTVTYTSLVFHWQQVIAKFLLPGTKSERGPVSVRVISDNGRKGDCLSLPVRFEQLTALARGLVNGQGLAVSRWVGSGKPFSRDEYDSLITELIKRGAAYWVNPDAHQQGVQLTRAGQAMMRTFASDTTTPLEEFNRK